MIVHIVKTEQCHKDFSEKISIEFKNKPYMIENRNSKRTLSYMAYNMVTNS